MNCCFACKKRCISISPTIYRQRLAWLSGMRHTDDQDHMKGNIGAGKFLDLMGIKEVDQSDQIWSRKEYSFRPQIFWNCFFLIFQVWEWETRLLHFILTWYSILKKVAIRTCLVLLQLTIIIQKLPQTEFSHFNLKCNFESFLIFHLNEDHKIHKRSFYFSWFFFFFLVKKCVSFKLLLLLSI